MISGDSLKISIITPSFMQGPFIAEAVESVLGQGYGCYEHIIFDNCSSDGTLDILKRYPQVRTIVEPDQGQSDALNKGFRAAAGDIVGWLNADDRYLPGCFEEVAGFFERHPQCDVLYGDYRWINEAGRVLQQRREIDFDLFILKYLHVLYIPSTATFFRRRILQEGNWLDPGYRYAMDYDFFLRLALKGYRFSHIRKFLADFRWHAGNKSLSVQQARCEQRRSLLSHDPFLRAFPKMLRPSAVAGLQGLARLKRYAEKAGQGFYASQWAADPDI